MKTELKDLADLTTPLNDLLNEIGQQGNVVAQQMYQAGGMVTHHNTDLWGDSAPQDNWLSSTYWPMGATWLVTHLMEHYRFTGDRVTLQSNYNLLRKAVVFALDFVTPYREYMVTNPSLSPENLYYVPNSTAEVAITYGPTIDNSLLWELIGELVDAQRELGINDKNLTDSAMALRSKLPPLRENQYGGIAEWIHDYKEVCLPSEQMRFLYAWILIPLICRLILAIDTGPCFGACTQVHRLQPPINPLSIGLFRASIVA